MSEGELVYRYQTSDETGISYSIEGIDSSYDGSGIVVDLSPSAGLNGTIELFKNLSDMDFIDQAARAFVAEANYFNPSLNLFCYSRIVLKISLFIYAYSYLNFLAMEQLFQLIFIQEHFNLEKQLQEQILALYKLIIFVFYFAIIS